MELINFETLVKDKKLNDKTDEEKVFGLIGYL